MHLVWGACILLIYYYNRDEFDKIVIGIDPGPRPGVAVMADGVLMEAFWVFFPMPLFQSAPASNCIAFGSVSKRSVQTAGRYGDRATGCLW